MGDPSSLEFMRSRRVFEINPEHPIIKSLNVSRCDFKGIIRALMLHIVAA